MSRRKTNGIRARRRRVRRLNREGLQRRQRGPPRLLGRRVPSLRPWPLEEGDHLSEWSPSTPKSMGDFPPSVTSERIPLGVFLLGSRDRASTDRSRPRSSLQVFVSSDEERVRSCMNLSDKVSGGIRGL